MNKPVPQRVADFFAPYRTRTYEKGEIIIQAEKDPSGIMYIVKGQVAQYDILPNGTEAIVNIYKVPAFFPMSWAINKTPNHFFFEAQTAVTVKQAPAEDVVAFLKSDPEVTYDLLSRAFRGTEGILKRMTFLMGGDAKNRLQFELLNAAYRFGTPLLGGKTRLELTETDLAKRSGLARETVSRTLRTLKADGILSVDTKNTNAFLLDIKQLENQSNI